MHQDKCILRCNRNIDHVIKCYFLCNSFICYLLQSQYSRLPACISKLGSSVPRNLDINEISMLKFYLKNAILLENIKFLFHNFF